MSTGGGLLFSWAYARGEASYLAVPEYSGFLWAAALGWLLIVGGCLVAARSRPAAPPEMDFA